MRQTAAEQEGLYMVTKIISGAVVERRKSRITRRPAKRGGRIRGNSGEKKIVGNREYAKLALARVLNCNFAPGDLWLTAKFDPEGGWRRSAAPTRGPRRPGRSSSTGWSTACASGAL